MKSSMGTIIMVPFLAVTSWIVYKKKNGKMEKIKFPKLKISIKADLEQKSVLIFQL